MIFQLTETLSEKILQAMENQDEKFLVDAKNCVLISETNANADEENYYSLPEWNSSKGFELRLSFVEQLHNPIAQDRLNEILHSGRGVFKNFKSEIKNFPVIEQQWHLFKNKRMQKLIGDWYNDLREIWGLEKLEQDPEDNENLLSDDFMFFPYKPADSQEILTISEMSGDFSGNWPQILKDVAEELWRRQFLSSDSQNQLGFICRTLSNEFAGCITVAPVSEKTKEAVVLTSFFVSEKYRGLGIGSELLGRCISKLKILKKEWIVLTNTIIPESMESLLLCSGFKKTGSGYSAEIQ